MAPAADEADGGGGSTLPWRIAAVWVILLVSYLGCVTPVLLLKKARRGKGRFHGRRCMHLLKTFSGGVVVVSFRVHAPCRAALRRGPLSHLPALRTHKHSR